MARLRKDGGFDERYSGGKFTLILLLAFGWFIFDYLSGPSDSYICELMNKHLNFCPDIYAVMV